MKFWQGLDLLGAVPSYYVLTFLFFVITSRAFFITFACMVLLVSGLTYLLKWLFALPRPGKKSLPRPSLLAHRKVDTYGFPSAHAGMAAGLVGVVSVVPGPWFALAIVFFILVAAGRLIQRKHDTLDVIAGTLIGLLLGLFSWQLSLLFW